MRTGAQAEPTLAKSIVSRNPLPMNSARRRQLSLYGHSSLALFCDTKRSTKLRGHGDSGGDDGDVSAGNSATTDGNAGRR